MRKKFINIILKRSEILVIIILIIYFFLMGIKNPLFVRADTVIRILFNGAILSIISMGISSVIITKNIDVSVGSLLGLAVYLWCYLFK